MIFPDILDHLSDGVQISDLSGKIVYMNDVSRKRLGINLQDMNQFYVHDFEPLFKDYTNWLNHTNELRNIGKLLILSRNRNQQTGEEIPVEVTVRLTTFEGQEFVVAVSRDITERVVNEKLKEQKSRFQEILMEISSTYINLAPGNFDATLNQSLAKIGRFVSADRAYIFEYNFTEGTATNTHEWCANGIPKQIQELQNVPLDFALDWPEKHKKGKVVLINDANLIEEPTRSFLQEQGIKSCITIPLLWINGCEGFVGFDQVSEARSFSVQEIDLLWLFSKMIMHVKNKISDQRRMQKLLNTTTEQYNRLSEYAFITSHNVRSSVANIAGLVELLREENDSILINHIEKSTKQLDTTIKHINELLDHEFSHKSLSKDNCNLLLTVDRAINLNKALIKQKNATVTLQIDKDITVMAYQAYLDSILFNLFNNALRYGVTDTNKLIEVIASIDSDNMVTIKVKDYGIGMDLANYGKKLFGMGYQFHKSKDGQGFGLFITKRQIESMGGDIDVLSSPNQGSTFIVSLKGAIKN